MTSDPTQLFERNRPQLHAVAYRMLGSLTEADDALQEAWLRLNSADASEVDNLDGWLTVIVSRICLDMLRRRRARREELVDEWDDAPVITLEAADQPEGQAMLADSVGIALLLVLETLRPDERLALVLHDMFDVPFDEIAPIIDRSVPATRQMTARARRRVRGRAIDADRVELGEQRRLIEAFLKASREGDLAGLLEILDPDINFKVDRGSAAHPIHARGAESASKLILAQAPLRAPYGRPALVNGRVGIAVILPDGLVSIASCEFNAGRISAMHIQADPEVISRVRY